MRLEGLHKEALNKLATEVSAALVSPLISKFEFQREAVRLVVKQLRQITAENERMAALNEESTHKMNRFHLFHVTCFILIVQFVRAVGVCARPLGTCQG